MRNQAEHITKALNGKWYGHYGIAFCPCHNNTKTPALSIKYDQHTSKLLVFCHSVCDSRDILNEFRLRGLIQGESLYYSTYTNKPPTKHKENDYTDYIQSLISESYPIEGTLAERYLRDTRKITCELSPNLIFHPYLKHAPSKQYFGCMIGLVASFENSTVKAIHRTYLDQDANKAPVIPNKMMLGNINGGGVFLSNSPNMVLVAAEGIETALSVKTDYPETNIIATLSSSGMKNLILPKPAGKLIIALDNDTAGLKAGYALAERAYANGWHVETIKPPKGQDFNDVLINKTNNSEIIL